jgi:hypothetical protein
LREIFRSGIFYSVIFVPFVAKFLSSFSHLVDPAAAD